MEAGREPAAQPLTYRAIVLGAVIVLGIGATAFTVLLWLYGGLDAIRTASAITVAAGGAAALLLAARRQRSTEETLEHQRQTLEHQPEVVQATERDAAEQRLAQNNPTQRQTIVDVLCSYLRMSYTPRVIKHRARTPPRMRIAAMSNAARNSLVRLTAQRILSAHLQPKEAEAYWENIDLAGGDLRWRLGKPSPVDW